MKIMFNEIWEVYLERGNEITTRSFILKGKDSELNVSLTGDCLFVNEGDIKKTIAKFMIDEIQDIYEFCQERDIRIDKERRTEDGLLAGEKIDFIIDNELYGRFINGAPSFHSINKSQARKLDDSYLSFAEQLESEFGDSIEDPETFNVLVNYQTEQILEIYVKKLLGIKIQDDRLEDLIFLYLNYSFMEANVNDLIGRREGSTGSIDKTRWILQEYRDFILSNKFPDMDQEHGEDDFHTKPNFGIAEDWIEFCESLAELHNGSPWRYVKILNRLIIMASNNE